MILAIESSCDESAVAMFSPQQGFIFEKIYSQVELHQKFGGVMPSLAAREHLSRLPWILEEHRAVLEAKRSQINEIVVTQGPGLPGALAMGIACAKTLSNLWNKPLVGVNHLIGHALSVFISVHSPKWDLSSYLPHLGLLVSGGNTLLFCLEEDRSFAILAQTVDDAAGEAFDKGGRLLGFLYPGGQFLSQKAIQGNRNRFPFPVAFEHGSTAKFSFSGLKTSLRYLLEKLSKETIELQKSDLCASYQEAIVKALVLQTKRAMKQRLYRSFGLSGGVSNNTILQERLSSLCEEQKTEFLLPFPAHRCDNAAMIAFAAHVMPEKTHSWDRLSFLPQWGLGENLTPPQKSN